MMMQGETCECGGHCGSCGGKVAFFGRVLLGLLFLIIGFSKITGFAGATAMIAAAGFPMPTLFTVLAILFEFGGALMLISGFHARTAAWMLIVFTAIATIVYHNPTTGDQLQMVMFLKNISIIGGLLYVTAFGAGAWSCAKWNHKFCKGGKMCPDCRVEMEDKPAM